ncbi:uroporphyrinogen-III synthase [Natronosporangium hydrolyticum]|uniref:Uroporphyrinogen-III synthase n=1 Tax=Natronosporangium hydrolyticum TaxID=2811111 RepID=A0A895YLE0_9ACTN|nr:uroporphyrinogen-III synthase [Natronosporangium hydrolyticum]QSB16123.1 uroporphyrinogen-III synthase [Natronosporangium hydrolyticum]
MSTGRDGAAGREEPLAGYTVGVTAARRRDELGALLQRRGARVVDAPAIQIVPLADDRELRAATEQCLAAPIDVAVATTGIGFRGWLEAAEGWGQAAALVAHLGRATLLARGPKARGAIRAAGLLDAWSPASESSSEVLEYLLAQGVSGQRIAVQLHGEPLPDFVEALEDAGATVVPVPVYRWVLPEDVAPLRRLVELTVTGQVDAVTFTSAPAVASLLQVADEIGHRAALLSALRHEVVPACVGPVTAGPLARLEVTTVQPDRYRLGALVRELAQVLPARARRLPVGGHLLEVRGHGVLLDGELVALPPSLIAVLRELARQPGRVRSRTELLAALPGGQDNAGHAVEMAVTRLRGALGARLIQTVTKRGYRLAFEPERESQGCLAQPEGRS